MPKNETPKGTDQAYRLEVSLDAALETLPLIKVDAEGRVQEANEQAVLLLGTPTRRLIGQPARWGSADRSDDLPAPSPGTMGTLQIGPDGPCHDVVSLAEDDGCHSIVLMGPAEEPHEQQNDTLAALSRSQAMIEFTPDGVILDANENFLAATGYSLEEIVGQHH